MASTKRIEEASETPVAQQGREGAATATASERIREARAEADALGKAVAFMTDPELAEESMAEVTLLREIATSYETAREAWSATRPRWIDNEYPIPGLTDDEEGSLRSSAAILDTYFA